MPFFFFFVGVIRFVHNCAVVTEGKDDNGCNDNAGNDNDEKDSDGDDNCRFDGDDAFFQAAFYSYFELTLLNFFLEALQLKKTPCVL